MTDKPIRILAIEDNDFDFELVTRRLRSFNLSHTIKRVFTEFDFTASLTEYSPDLIISDFSIPSFGGMDALKIVKAYYPHIPFIFVSGTIGEELAVETLREGAVDYVLKDNLDKLEHSIRRALEESKEKERRKHAEKQLHNKVHELKTLVYRISHDFRSPLCSIEGVLNLIRDSDCQSPEEFKEYVRLIAKVVNKMNGIISNLNNFQYIYADEVKVEVRSLEELREKLIEKISKIQGYQDVHFEFSLTGEPEISLEFNLLISICFNLIHNSITFADQNKDQQKVRCHIDCSGNLVSIIVEDNGIGIPENIKDKVCEMFFRGSTRSNGAGLGLFVTKEILERLNGKIKIESRETNGTKVSILIPMQTNKDFNVLVNN
jgi:signal transduction histidine kinase